MRAMGRPQTSLPQKAKGAVGLKCLLRVARFYLLSFWGLTQKLACIHLKGIETFSENVQCFNFEAETGHCRCRLCNLGIPGHVAVDGRILRVPGRIVCSLRSFEGRKFEAPNGFIQVCYSWVVND
ncbi:hypothetical protein P280DRAFT_174310 [Massarina eburnea CBS 473.64]|uniref:Uncharacterized protein n=1 Tax=Massarina eburnea CBS 473.64 TaxID=1395130 RepID=A0A6A6SCH3_9PLEO|nr:hypothetical protein P280DRAFT_174310 [Massarina eburnea CBS 473.64]